MSGSGAIRAGKAFVEFALRDGAMRKGLKKWEARFRDFGARIRNVGGLLTGAGGLIAGGLGGAAKVFADSGSELADMSKRTGLSVESLSELRYAAQQAGSSLAVVEKAAREMQSRGLDPKLFDEFLGQLAAIENPTQRAQMAFELFGKKTGSSILPLVDELTTLRKRAQELGLVMSAEDAAAADELGDNLDTLWAQLKRVVEVVGAAVAGPFNQLLTASQGIIRQVIDWISANRQTVQTVLLVAAGVMGLGGVLVAAGVAFQLIGFAAAGLSAALGIVATALGVVLSPVGLLVASGAGVVYWFTTMTETGRAMAASLASYFGELAGIVKETFGAIAAALGAGDVEAAGKVLWSGLKLLWLQGTQSLRETWHNLTAGIVKVWFTTWAGVQQVWNVISGNLERGWSHTTEFFATAWDTWVGAFKKSWNATVAFFEKTWLRIKGLFGADVQSEIDRINSDLAKANSQIDAEVANRAADRNAAGQAAREQSRQEQAATLDKIGADLNANLAGADDAAKEKIAAAQRDLDASRSAWREATAAAKAVGEAAKSQRTADADLGNGLAAATTGATSKATSMGTFNAEAIIALQSGGTAEEETAKNTAATVKQLGELNRALTTGNLLGIIAN